MMPVRGIIRYSLCFLSGINVYEVCYDKRFMDVKVLFVGDIGTRYGDLSL